MECHNSIFQPTAVAPKGRFAKACARDVEAAAQKARVSPGASAGGLRVVGVGRSKKGVLVVSAANVANRRINH